jgi:hypothetical protein
MFILIILVITDYCHFAHTCVGIPQSFAKKIMDKLLCSYLSVMFPCHLICTHLGGANHILLQKLNILYLVENSNWLSLITKKGILKVHLVPPSGFWMRDDNQLEV